MARSRNPMTEIISRVVDTASAAYATVWSRSTSAREVARLALDGYAAGAPCEIAWSLFLPDRAAVDRALVEARNHGFSLGERGDGPEGFATIRTTVPLTPFALSRAGARANRLARRHDGFAELIGPVSTPAAPAGEGRRSSNRTVAA